tara:strand:+ start:18061 stop:19638 length:1578 start_codon:yes stop_codon:yes gene_type:complete
VMDQKREVLYQKWRPKYFRDVAGQEHITNTLKNSLIRKKFSHAYLFTGPRGVGKTTTARIMAKALNVDIDKIGEPNLESEISKLIDESKFLDLIEIDAASNRRIDDIRSLLDNIQFMPSMGKYKVYIIDEVHMLTNEAFNALLKTLEEPPPQIVMILATTEYQKLPETIISRCQRFDFRYVPNLEIVNRLKVIAKAEKINCEDNILWFIAMNSYGSLRDACNLLEQLSIAFDEITIEKARTLFGIIDENISIELINFVLNNQSEKLIKSLDELKSKGIDFQNLSKIIMETLRAGLFISQGLNTIQGYSKEYIEKVSETFSDIDGKILIDIIENHLKITSIRTDNFQLLLESSLIHMLFLFNDLNKAPSSRNIIKELKIEEDKIVQKINPVKDSVETITKTENFTTESKKEWEEVLFDLRREKFGKMYLGALLRNVETPQVEDEKLRLKFKSKTLHDLFKEEWKIDGAREAVKKAVLKVFGKDVGLVLEEPKTNVDPMDKTNNKILESNIVKSALAMGAKIEEEEE